jgi:hypothetical protein
MPVAQSAQKLLFYPSCKVLLPYALNFQFWRATNKSFWATPLSLGSLPSGHHL